MWVRSQDKEVLADVNRFEISWREHKGQNERIYIIWGYSAMQLAFYSTHKKAMKVMNMLEKHINKSNNYYNHYTGEPNIIATQEVKVFQFPKDEEVILDE